MFLSKLFGSEEREIKKIQPIVEKINDLEASLVKLSDAELKAKTSEFRTRIADGETLDQILPEAFAVVREGVKRVDGKRLFDVQLIGGIVLHRGKIAEMKTGEGKTHTATTAVYLNALSGKGVHVVTVNDYLARRDANWMGPIYHFLGLSTGCIQHDASFLFEPKVIDTSEVSVEMENLSSVSRKEAYGADITYGTNNEFGFDYLRDNMAQSFEQCVQRVSGKTGELNYAIVDEVDSILIDEARTPLIISAPDAESTVMYQQFARLVPRLKREEDFTVEEKTKSVTLTENGMKRVEELLGMGNIYDLAKISYVHHLEQALKAHIIFKRDRDYVVKPATPAGGEGEVIIVDDFTGRLMPGRRYSEGLHQAIEAKENVKVQKESRTLATITFQNYFRMYGKLAGMTGTAATSAEEFFKVYKLEVLQIPTNQPMIRKDLPDAVYKTEAGKFQAVVREIKERNDKGQPVLVGTIAIEKSELLHEMLEQEGIHHEVLNAKNHEREAQIIAEAGQRAAVTIATNMAGRGTDIKLGEGVRELGGLHIIGTERHEARRIDNQLRGRAGRQGDPGSSLFFVSLEDELMRRFGGEKIKGIMDRLGLPEDQPIENSMITKSIESAQAKIEGYNFDIRKHVLEYDDVMNRQREAIYKKRREILMNKSLKNDIMNDVEEEIEQLVGVYASGNYEDWNVLELCAKLQNIFVSGENIFAKIDEIRKSKDEINDAEKMTKIVEYLKGLAKEVYNKKEAQIGADIMRAMEKAIYLRSIDTFWMNHLDEMEYLRGGIGLRGYGQRDPLVEYKKEGYLMFQNLLGSVRSAVVNTVYKVQFSNPEEKEEKNILSQAKFQGAEEQPAQFGAVKEVSGEKSTAQKQIVNREEIGRNEPCPCGSGRKYKKCCGK